MILYCEIIDFQLEKQQKKNTHTHTNKKTKSKKRAEASCETNFSHDKRWYAYLNKHTFVCSLLIENDFDDLISPRHKTIIN